MNLTTAQRLRILASAGKPYDIARVRHIQDVLDERREDPIQNTLEALWADLAEGPLLDLKIMVHVPGGDCRESRGEGSSDRVGPGHDLRSSLRSPHEPSSHSGALARVRESNGSGD